METKDNMKASFQGICKQIENSILDSKKSIFVAVAWFTNKELLGLLTEKAKEGLSVKIVVSDDIINKRLNPSDFLSFGGEYKILPTNSSKFLHEKFAIFDEKSIIVGSYNWTYSAEYKNHESVIITNHEQIIKQYSIRFKNLLGEVLNYDISHLIENKNNGVDLAEKEFQNLENDLENEFMEALKESKKLNVKINFDFVYEFLKTYGAIGAAKRLMLSGTEKIQSGFIKMWEIGRVDLTFESIITKEKYQFLFDKKTLEVATDRLQKIK